jgi:hypothetical protein
MLISVEGRGKNQIQAGQEIMGTFQYFYLVLGLEILDQNRPVCWSITVNEKSNVSS